ncbi:Replication factor A protein 3 [Dillenia turbinata]|uniref:Replication factor A protein 3 n=1 Tax=Dillenia turbinata TaxID=194707 RepID=A0AAN8W6B8_9MAGN
MEWLSTPTELNENHAVAVTVIVAKKEESLHSLLKWIWIPQSLKVLLGMYVGRRIRAVIQIVKSDGGTVVGKSTDECRLVVKGALLPNPLGSYVEVIGIADSNQSINAETWTNFGNGFGMTLCFPIVS